MPPKSDMFLLILTALALLLLIGVAAVLLLRRRAGGRQAAARDMCTMLDSYLDTLVEQQARPFDAERLWDRLEQARALHREHFPELYSEMLELARVHGELTSVLLEEHMRRHGAPTQSDLEQANSRLEDLQQRAAEAVLRLKRRCRMLAQVDADSQID